MEVNNMLKGFFVFLLLFSIASVALIACGSTTTTPQAGNEVHLSDAQFSQSSITLHKGESLMLVDDSSNSHVIANGMWKDGAAQTVQEPNAPQVNALQIAGNGTASIGPFAMSGTFHLYCTIHVDMNLTVIVH
jgi:plastocyanin